MVSCVACHKQVVPLASHSGEGDPGLVTTVLVVAARAMEATRWLVVAKHLQGILNCMQQLAPILATHEKPASLKNPSTQRARGLALASCSGQATLPSDKCPPGKRGHGVQGVEVYQLGVRLPDSENSIKGGAAAESCAAQCANSLLQAPVSSTALDYGAATAGVAVPPAPSGRWWGHSMVLHGGAAQTSSVAYFISISLIPALFAAHLEGVDHLAGRRIYT